MVRFLLAVLISSCLGVFAATASAEPAAPDPPRATDSSAQEGWPATCQEAIDRLVRELDEPSKERVRRTRREDLIRFHRGWGTGIRNDYGMWRGNKALVDSCIARRPGTQRHPDGASMIIIEGVWDALQKGP